jgi:hypothetical protein
MGIERRLHSLNPKVADMHACKLSTPSLLWLEILRGIRTVEPQVRAPLIAYITL